MADNITGSVVGKVKFQIDQPSWKALEKFQAKLTSVKRQMSTMHKTIKVQAVVKQMTDVTKKVTNNSIAEKKREMNAHVAAKQKHDQQMGKLYDRALAEDRRRDATRIRQAERANAQMLRADLRLDAQRQRMLSKEAGASSRFGSRAAMYTQVKMQQARIAGVDDAGLAKIQARSAQAMNTSGGDIAVFRHQLQQTTKDLIHNTRELNNNRVTLRSLRTDLVQMTAAYTAFSGIVNIAQSAMEMEGMRAAAKVFAKDEEGVAKHMTFIANEADRLGVNLMTATKEFTKFSISTNNRLSREGQMTMFSGISEYAAVMQLDQQQYERAFRSIQQMFSKNQIMAEEVKNQMAESLYGSIPIMAEAFGFTGETGVAEFFKAMERGELTANEKQMTDFAKGLSRVAKQNGALESVTKKTRAEMSRFFNTLTQGKDAIFLGGMDEGLAYMFGNLSDLFKELTPAAKAFGAAFKGITSTLTAGLNIALLPLRALNSTLSSIGLDDKSSGMIWNFVGAGGALYLMARGFQAIAFAIGATNIGLLTMIGRIAMLAAPALAIDDIFGSATGRKSATASGGALAPDNALSRYGIFWANERMKDGSTDIRIFFDSEEAKKFVRIESSKSMQQQITSLDDSNGG